MSDTQNLAYAVVQVVHNFGALATVGGSLAASRLTRPETRMRLAKLALGGWIIQGASGAAFGATSYYFYHQLPELSRVAVGALSLKMVCVTAGIIVLGMYLWRSKSRNRVSGRKSCLASSVLAVTALTAAAFLRWFS